MQVTDVMKQLDAFRAELDWQLACGALAEMELPVTDNDGDHPVVVALEDEPLSILLGRLRAVGGYANVFVRSTDGKVQQASVVDTNCAIPAPDDGLSRPDERPGATATVGMFLAYVARCRRGVRLSLAPHPSEARDVRPVEFASAS